MYQNVFFVKVEKTDAFQISKDSSRNRNILSGAGHEVLRALLSTPPADPTLLNAPEPWYMQFAGEWWKQARWYSKQSTCILSDNIVFVCEVQNTSLRTTRSFWLEFESLPQCPDYLVAYQIHEYGRCAFREAIWTSCRHRTLFSADPDDTPELFKVPKALMNQAGQLRPLMSHPRSLILRSAAGTYLPQRFLRGFLPEVLLQNRFQFWQVSETCIDGRQSVCKSYEGILLCTVRLDVSSLADLRIHVIHVILWFMEVRDTFWTSMNAFFCFESHNLMFFHVICHVFKGDVSVNSIRSF